MSSPERQAPGRVSRTQLRAPLAVNIDPQVRERARAAIAGLRGTEDSIDGGMSGLVNAALAHELRRLEVEHNDGKPFPNVDRLHRGPAR